MPQSPLPRCVVVILLLAGFQFLGARASFGQGGSSYNTDGNTPSFIQAGAPAGSYSIGNFENVNLFGGNLNFTMPLSKIGGRGEVGYSINLPLDQRWRVKQVGVSFENDPYPDGDSGGGPSFPPGVPIYQPDGKLWSGSSPGYGPGVLLGRRAGVGQQGDGRYWNNINEAWYPKCQPSVRLYEATLTRLTFMQSDGTEVELRDVSTNGKPAQVLQCTQTPFSRGTVFKSSDGSNLTFIADTAIDDYNFQPMPSSVENFSPTGYLLTNGGQKYRIVGGRIESIKDRQGNQLSFTFNTGQLSGGRTNISTITDLLGRQTDITYAAGSVEYDEIAFKGTGGASRSVKIWYKTLADVLRPDSALKTYAQLFPLMPDAPTNSFNPRKVSAVELPDGRRFEFLYNSYGELARTVSPIGGATEYDWNFGAGNKKEKIIRRITERRTYHDNALENKTAYLATLENGPTKVAVETRDAGGTLLARTDHYFGGNPIEDGAPEWAPIFYPQCDEGREYQTDVFDVVNGLPVLKQTTVQTWEQRAPVAWYNAGGVNPFQYFQPANDPRLVETRTTLVDSNQVTKTVYGYNPNVAYNQQTDVYEYDFGTGAPGAFKRRSHTDYLVTNPVNSIDYTSDAIHLLNLPIQRWVSSDAAGNNRVTLSQIEYDNYAADAGHAALVPRSGVINFDAINYGASNTKRGNPTAVTSYQTVSGQTYSNPLTAYAQYDVLGNVVKTIDAKGNISAVSYNDRFGSPDSEAQSNTSPAQLNGQSTFAFPTSGTNALGWVIGYTQYDYFTGAPVNTENINGIISKTVYNDALDRPTQTVSAIGTQYEQQANVIYDDANHRVQQTGDLKTLNDNLLKSESFYDGLGRTYETRKYEANGGYIVSKTEYDGLSRAKRATNPYRPNEINASNPVLWTEIFYDALGRVTKVKTPDNAEVNTSYSGNTVTVTDQAGNQRRSITNALGQLKRVDEPTDANGLGAVDSPNQATSYSYDTLNNLITVNQGSQTRSFGYDSLSRLRQASNPESGTISYNYDNNGNLTQKTDARNVQTNYFYDALNRVTNRSYANEPATPTATQAATRPVFYTYDDPGVAFSKGKLTKVVTGGSGDVFSVTEYQAFDQMGRVLAHRQTTDGNVYNTAYSYNLSGALLEETYPSGRVVKNTLDADGDLAQVQSKKNSNSGYQNYAGAFTYTAAGAVSSLRLGNGRWESTQFNSRLQPTQIALGSTQNAVNLLKLDYTYSTANNADNNGNVRTQTITTPNVGSNAGFTATQTYNYDSLNRLKDATETAVTSGQTASVQTWKQTFIYDRYGNRQFEMANTTAPNVQSGSAKVINPEVLTSNNRLKQDQDNDNLPDYLYDAAGNVTQSPTVASDNRTFKYDGESKQIQVSSPSGTIGQYVYDGDGKRVKKISAAEITIFVYDAGGKMVAEYSNVVASQTEAKVSYLTSDNLGTPRINTDTNGAVISRHDYQPFGEEIASAQRTAGNSYQSDTVRQGFTGYEDDKETDLNFAQARYQDDSHGRFTSPDPMMASARRANPQTFNRYSYVINNPLNLIDPSGLSGCPPHTNCWTDGEGDSHWTDANGDEVINIHSPANPSPNSVPPAAGLVAPMTPPTVAPPVTVPPIIPEVAPGVGRIILSTTGRAALVSLVAPAIVIGILAGTAQAPSPPRTATTTTTDDDDDDSDILYRGVRFGGHGYSDALLGIARPRGGLIYDADDHNDGFTDSIYTSWSHNVSTASWYANRLGQGGVVLTSRIPRSRQQISKDRFDEEEVLVRGVVTGANVRIIKPK